MIPSPALLLLCRPGLLDFAPIDLPRQFSQILGVGRSDQGPSTCRRNWTRGPPSCGIVDCSCGLRPNPQLPGISRQSTPLMPAFSRPGRVPGPPARGKSPAWPCLVPTPITRWAARRLFAESSRPNDHGLVFAQGSTTVTPTVRDRELRSPSAGAATDLSRRPGLEAEQGPRDWRPQGRDQSPPKISHVVKRLP